jgi:DNA-binding transcriptional LysR family regulator
MDRLDELALFTAIVEEGSLAAAGRRLRRSPPAVTRALAGLEARLGVRLIERSTRRLNPTAAGRRLAEQARGLLADYAAAFGEAADAGTAPRGLLRIAAPLVFGRRHLAPLVGSFLALHPAVQVELLLADRPVDLVEEGIDVALRIGTPGGSSLVSRRVGEVRRVVAASPAYLARRGTPSTPAELAAHDIVAFSGLIGGIEWRFAGGTTVRLQPRCTINEAAAVTEAAIAGHGIINLLSYQLAEPVADGRLLPLLEAVAPPPLPVQLLFPSARLMAPRLRAFINYVAPRLAALPVLR